MKILQILPALETGGVERGTVEMVRAIAADGGQALVASAGGRLVPQLERAGGEHIALPLATKDPLNLLINAGRLQGVIRRHKVQLVHARSRAPAWSAWLAARRTRTPFVTTWHGVYGENFPGKRLYNSIMARGARVIAISRFVASLVATRYGVGPDRLRIIPRGVDAAYFDPARVSGDRIHRLAEAWRLPPGARVVMLPARLTRWKGAEKLLDALASLPPDPDRYCVLVGSDQGRHAFAASLIARARKLGLGDMLRLAGHCDDMPAALMLADIVVSASLKPEGFGRTVIEAQAMGRPIVAFDHGGAAETVSHGETGFLVPQGSVPALAAAIGQALALPADARHTLCAAARAAVLANYTTAAMQAATLNVYRELLG